MSIPVNQQPIIIDLERLNTGNARGCAACNQKFTLGERVVLACGFWDGGQRLIHESEGVFDSATGQWVERACHTARYTARTPA